MMEVDPRVSSCNYKIWGNKRTRYACVSLVKPKTSTVFSIIFKEQIWRYQHLLGWIIFTAGLYHHSSYFILFGSIGFSQIGSLFNRQLFDTHIRNTFKPTQPKTTPLTQSCKEQHNTSWGCMKRAAYRKYRCPEDVLGSPCTVITWCLCAC